MQGEKNKVPCGWLVLIGVLVFLLVSFGVALFVHSFLFKDEIKPVQKSEDGTEWDHDVERLKLEERGITLIRILSRQRCYIMPEVSDNKTPKHWLIVQDELNQHSIEEIGGSWTKQFCQGLSVFMLRSPDKTAASTIVISKRQAGPPPGAAPMDGSVPAGGANSSNAGAPAQAGGSAGPSPPGGSGPAQPKSNVNTEHRPSGLDVPIEQREPRCDDTFLDCVVSIGKKVTCFSWTNGVIKLDQECMQGNQFRVSMTKPPGRILKLAQEQWRICVERKMQGLKC